MAVQFPFSMHSLSHFLSSNDLLIPNPGLQVKLTISRYRKEEPLRVEQFVFPGSPQEIPIRRNNHDLIPESQRA